MSTIAELRKSKPTNMLYTPEDLLTIPDGDRFELVDGQLRETNMGHESSWVGTALVARMFHYCEAGKLGWVQGAEASYQCFPGRPNLVRRPDVSFVKYGRFAGEELPAGHAKLPPDQATEVVSPNDLSEETMEKVQNYLAAGVRLIWIIYPRTRVALVYRLNGSISLVNADQELSGEDVVPGFACRVRDILPPPSATSDQ